MVFPELGDELGFDDFGFGGEIFVMMFLVTKFRRRCPDDVSGDEIFSPKTSSDEFDDKVDNEISSPETYGRMPATKFRYQKRHDKNFTVKIIMPKISSSKSSKPNSS